MSDPRIVVLNWDKFQHADATKRGRDPIWIKAYTRLHSDDNYLNLTLSQRGLLHGIWLEYARSGKALTTTRTRHLLCTNKADSRHFTKHLDAIAQAGFIEIRQDPKPDTVTPPSSPKETLSNKRSFVASYVDTVEPVKEPVKVVSDGNGGRGRLPDAEWMKSWRPGDPVPVDESGAVGGAPRRLALEAAARAGVVSARTELIRMDAEELAKGDQA